MQEQEPKRLKDLAGSSNPTDRNLDNPDNDPFVEELRQKIEAADRLEGCMSCRKCMGILDVLRKISLDARNELVQVNPQNANEVMRLQQTAKMFDAVELVIRNTINQGQLALDQISPREE